ncbi:MAG: acyl-CoA thioesterase [Pseudomonadota bacterium]
MTIHSATFRVSFGDCDPAGLVFYPNFFAWLDATFHGFLADKAGGHGTLCKTLGAKGIGLVSAQSDFHVPVTDGDDLSIALSEIDWDRRRFTLRYEGQVRERTVFKGCETRALFVIEDGRIRAGDLSDLRNILEN